MHLEECRREAEMVSAVYGGGWPDEGTELGAHIGRCPVCLEVADVAARLGAERRSLAHVSVPSASRVWWRAQMRARVEAAQVAAQPMSVAQGLAVAAATALTAVAVRWAWPSIARTGAWAGGFANEALGAMGPYGGGIVQLGLWLTVGLAALVLVPVVVFWMMIDE